MGIYSRGVGAFCILFFMLSGLTGAQQVAPQPLITRPIDETRLVTLRGNTHPLAQPQFDIGTAPPDLPLNRMLLVLKRSDQQEHALRTLLDDQQDKASPNYHKWLTPDQFGTVFGPSDQDVQAVTNWLQSHGLQVNRVSRGKTIIEFSGVESQVEAAFNTQIHSYLLPNGEQHWANASDPQIPAAIVPAVAGVWSMHDFRKKTNIQVSPIKLKTRYIPGARPDTTFNNGFHALGPADFATIYNLNPVYSSGNTGQNIGIAVVARSDTFGSDIFDFRNIFGVCCGSFQQITNGPDPGDLGGGEEAEATLDATWSWAIAPNADLKFVVSASTNTTDGVDLSELYIVDNNVAPIMTESFSTCEAFASPSEAQGISALAEQAAAEGITYMVSSGDSGGAECDDPNFAPATHGQSVNLLASTAFTVAVGGTEFNENGNTGLYWSTNNNQSNFGSALKYIPENVWNESCSTCQSPNLFSSGGGASTLVASPTWQFGVQGIPASATKRLVPDVALNAAGGHDPYLLCLEGSCIPDSQGLISFAAIGGTSASAPSFAGIMALVNQKQNAPQGQANYVLYQLAATENYSQCNGSSTTGSPASTCTFNDVTSGNNSVPGQIGFTAGAGYDEVTGLGSVNVNNLVNNWSKISFTATTATLGPSSITGSHGAPVTLTTSVAPNSGSGTPTGDVALNTSNGQNVGFLTLTNGSASSSVRNLPGGTYTLTARYGGDKNFAPSPPSTAINVSITPENSTTTASVFGVDANGNPVPFTSGAYGGFIYPRADVAGQSGQGTPTGFLYFFDNGSQVGGINYLNSGGNTGFPNGCWGCFHPGQHSLTAFYAGDSSFDSSTSAPITFTITPATTSTTLSATPTSGAQGTTISLTATISTAAFAGATQFATFPFGTVTFWNGSTQIGSSPVFQNGQSPNGLTVVAPFSTSSLPNGANSITAQYSGDTNYSPSSSSAITVNISADFTFAPGSSTVNAAQGGSTTNTLTITGQTGYNNTINFTPASCTGLPTLTTCSFNPTTVTGSGSTTVTIKTTAPSSAAVRSAFGVMAAGLLFAGVLLLGVPSRRLRSYGTLGIVLCVLTLGSVACGGGGSNGCGSGGSCGNSGTPKGSYPITITATTTDQTVSHAVTFTLVVQ